MAPPVFLSIHLAIILTALAAAGVSARRARTGPWRGRAGRYRRLSTKDVLRRLGRPPS